ncbi:MAG: aminotransferase class IV [Bacteroidia bacterium]|nr:aminotransferase class IV [Bacteroidia bacterium]
MWLHFVNGSWEQTPPPTRGELFGDGIFESFHIRKGKALFLEDHFRRLRQGATVLSLEPPTSWETLFQEIQRIATSFDSARGKVVLYRKGEGAYTPLTTEAGIRASFSPLSSTPFPLASPQRLIRFPVQFLSLTPWSPFKTLSAVGYVQSAAYAQAQRCGDALLLSTEGFLSETSRANLFFWDGAVLHTPALRSGCINGVMRAQILRQARALRIPVEEGLYPYEVLLNSQEVFTTNVIQGITPVLGLHGEKASFRTGEDTLAFLIAKTLFSEGRI